MRFTITLILFTIFVAVIRAAHAKPPQLADEYNTGMDEVDGDIDDQYDDDEDEDESSKAATNDEKPKINSKPLDILAKPGETVQLPCDVENGDDFVVLWKKNDTPIFQDKTDFTDRIGRKITLEENSTITIQNVSENDTADYICSVLVATYESIDVVHRVRIVSSPRITFLGTKNGETKLKQGDNLELICKTEGEPKPQVKWYFENSAIKQERSVFTGETYEIENIGYDNSGLYRCVADNGKIAHKAIAIEIIHKPVVNIEKIYTDRILREVVCVVHANPPARVTWKKDGAHFRSSEHAKTSDDGRRHVIAFSSLAESDFGEYTCVAKNDDGEGSSTVQITKVPEKPHLSSSKSAKPKEWTLEWTVHSHQPILECEISYEDKVAEFPKVVSPQLTNTTDDNVFTISHTFSDMKKGHYVAKLKCKNKYGWGMFSNGTQFEITGSRHSHRNKHHGSHTKDNAVMDKGESQTEQRPNNQEDIKTGYQSSDAVQLLPTTLVLYVALIFLRQ